MSEQVSPDYRQSARLQDEEDQRAAEAAATLVEDEKMLRGEAAGL